MDLSAATIRQVLRRVRVAADRRLHPLPLLGYDPPADAVPLLDRLSDADLDALNRMLPWSCFTVDGRGRRFGDRAWRGKRETPAALPDPRIVLLDERVPLAGLHVLEFGCFEGVHTIALCRRAAEVTAVDARLENVVKTIVRSSFHGCHPRVFAADIDEPVALTEMEALAADVVHHVGVLYHLRDPVRHLQALGRIARRAVMLDTHVATDEDATASMVVDGETFRYERHEEGGRLDVFSGTSDHSKWLTERTVVDLLHRAGFADVDVTERRAERNGSRVLIFAVR